MQDIKRKLCNMLYIWILQCSNWMKCVSSFREFTDDEDKDSEINGFNMNHITKNVSNFIVQNILCSEISVCAKTKVNQAVYNVTMFHEDPFLVIPSINVNCKIKMYMCNVS